MTPVRLAPWPVRSWGEGCTLENGFAAGRHCCCFRNTCTLAPKTPLSSFLPKHRCSEIKQNGILDARSVRCADAGPSGPAVSQTWLPSAHLENSVDGYT